MPYNMEEIKRKIMGNNNVFGFKQLMIKFKKSPKKTEAFNIIISILPISLLVLSLLLYPVLNVFFHGFTKWTISGTTFIGLGNYKDCLLYTSPSPRDRTRSRMPSSA